VGDLRNCTYSNSLFNNVLFCELGVCEDGGALSPDLQPAINRSIAFLSDLRTSMLQDACLASQRVYRFETLVRCLLIGGDLRNSAKLKSVILTSMGVYLPVEIRDYFERLFQEDQKLPSKTTVYRHRLSLHLGFCYLLQDIHASILDSRGGAGETFFILFALQSRPRNQVCFPQAKWKPNVFEIPYIRITNFKIFTTTYMLFRTFLKIAVLLFR